MWASVRPAASHAAGPPPTPLSRPRRPAGDPDPIRVPHPSPPGRRAAPPPPPKRRRARGRSVAQAPAPRRGSAPAGRRRRAAGAAAAGCEVGGGAEERERRSGGGVSELRICLAQSLSHSRFPSLPPSVGALHWRGHGADPGTAPRTRAGARHRCSLRARGKTSLSCRGKTSGAHCSTAARLLRVRHNCVIKCPVVRKIVQGKSMSAAHRNAELLIVK